MRSGLRARPVRSTLVDVRIRGGTALLLMLLPSLSCEGKRGDTTTSPPASAAASAAQATPWSREAFPLAASGAPSSDPATVPKVDPAALDQLIARAPKIERRPTGSDGATAVGKQGELALASEVAPRAAPAAAESEGAPKGVAGAQAVQPIVAKPAIERAARADLYWDLLQRCRDPEGRILPPEVIRLQFRVDREGYVLPSTIVAMPRDPRFTDAARCMQRALSTAPFQAPAATRGRDYAVDVAVPSVD